ncbi:hypothetical protein AYO22_11318 [Fonsecaea multimorphosa]|nr:hypothetical protein AYO22_11318 [Fonsecaea multimorphosa]
MDSHPSSAYEPYRHAADADKAERNLDPADDAQTLLGQQQRSQKARPLKGRASHDPLQLVRGILRASALILAITILAFQGYSAYTWLNTRHQSSKNVRTGLQTASWAVLDMWPTWTILSVAALATVVYMLAFGSLCGCVCSGV